MSEGRGSPEARREQRLRELGTRSPHCQLCLEEDPFALTGVAPDILCYECRRKQVAYEEAHHIAGQYNDPLTVNLPGNMHRLISERQLGWPKQTLRNPDGSPLLKAAAWLRGYVDMMFVLIERGLAWIPDFLEWLDARLRELIGDHWWIKLGWTKN